MIVPDHQIARGARAARALAAAGVLLALVASVLMFAIPRLAHGNNEARLERAAKISAAEGEAREAWQDRYRELLAARDSARIRYELAHEEYVKRRHRQRLRGELKAELMTELAESEAALEAAQNELDAFPDQARQAGIPMGWLRDAAP